MKSSLFTGYLLILNTILFFSSFEVVSRTIAVIYSPFYINVLRFFIGGCVLFVSLYVKKEIRIPPGEIKHTLFLGILNVCVSMNLLQFSLSMEGASAALAAVLFSTNPVFVILFAHLFGEEKITGTMLVSLLVSVTGVGIIFWDRIALQNSSLIPAVLALLSSIIFGLYTLYAGKVTKRIGSLTMNAYSFLGGSILSAIVLLVLSPHSFTVPVVGIGRVLYLGICVSGIAYLSYFSGLAIIGTGKGSMVFFLKPVTASLLAYLFLSESFSPGFLGGTVCIMTGVLLSIQKKTKKPL